MALRLRLALMGVCGMAALTGCDDGPQCVVDRDCDPGDRCTPNGNCVPIGRDGGADAGAGEGGVDAGTDAAAPDASMDGGVDGGPDLLRQGSITASSHRFGTEDSGITESYTVRARFEVIEGERRCERTTFEGTGCRVVECPPPPDPTDAGMPDAGTTDASTPAIPHAGTITVTGGTTDVLLTPSDLGVYAPETDSMRLWTEPTTLSYSASGEDVPSFSGVEVRTPGTVMVTLPDLSSTPVAVDPTAEMSVSWTGAPEDAEGAVVYALRTASTEDSGMTTIRCFFEATDGSGTIPEMVMDRIPESATSGTMWAFVWNAINHEDAGDWKITVAARTPARRTSPPNSEARAPVEFAR